jgi:hypothetical protein
MAPSVVMMGLVSYIVMLGVFILNFVMVSFTAVIKLQNTKKYPVQKFFKFQYYFFPDFGHPQLPSRRLRILVDQGPML